ncbi:MAG: YncE family protein [Planctomycetes bacterium]|nr:YncE family protein [Planctomycetota bacterium]
MSFIRMDAVVATAALLAPLASAQHAQVTAIAVNPTNPNEVWVCNRDNNSVSVIDTVSGAATHEIDVGVRPRSLSFSADGTRVFVANQRGNVPVTSNMALGFTGSEIRGTLSVIDTASKTVATTLTNVGTEPYGVAVAPNGKYFAVTAFRTGAVLLFRTSNLSQAASYQYLANLSYIPAPYTIVDADSNRDGMADLGEPRGFTIRSDSSRIYVTHNRSPFVSVLDVALDANGSPTGLSLSAKIGLNTYPFDPFYNPVAVRTVESQGLPRFLEDIALSPDGSRALVPHLLHNINHDVNFAFPAYLPGAFANRVYPALSVIDTAANSFAQPGDQSRSLENELLDSMTPAEFAAYGRGDATPVGIATLGGVGEPIVGTSLVMQVEGLAPGQSAIVYIGGEANVPAGPLGTKYVHPRLAFPANPLGQVAIPIPLLARLKGVVTQAQALIFDNGQPAHYSNGLKIRFHRIGTGLNKLGHRAGHPGRVVYDASGTHALMLNRGSEDLFLYDVNGSDMQLAAVFPPRVEFSERAALDTSTAMGDLPLGMVLVADPSTSNNDALVYIANELTRTVSVLRVDWNARTILQEHAQIPTLLTPDLYTHSQVLGDELFEDASRGQTTGAPGTIGEFNNSCASCHFEGGEDGNVWQRPAGPRSTMPVYGGSLGTGLLLWKGVRLHMGETGPMFGGENGGHGVLSDTEQQALVDAHNVTPVPLNPNLDPLTGGLTPTAAFGRDLFFGINDTGLNPTLRAAGCASCHAQSDGAGGVRGFTVDFLDPMLTTGENLAQYDPGCVSLATNIVDANVRNVNSGVNVDFNNNGIPDPDRNADGYIDVETYSPLNADKADPFSRDDVNSYRCPTNPANPQSPLKVFQRDMRKFSVPTKLGVFSTGPYFHDHLAYSLRTIVDPEVVGSSPIYGSPAWTNGVNYPGVQKLFNEFHDIRGHEQFVQGASKVQPDLLSGANVNSDIEAILAFIQSI